MGHTHSWPTTGQQAAFGRLRILFGVIWLINAWFQARSVYLGHFLNWFAQHRNGESSWVHAYIGWIVHGIQGTGTLPIEAIIILVDLLLALSLLTGRSLRVSGIVGILYSLFVWSAMGALGEPYGFGNANPGPGIIYAIAFVFVILAASLETHAGMVGDADSATPPGNSTEATGSWINRFLVGRVLFGLLWAFDAWWAWHPYFFHHFPSYIKQAEVGQPGWIVAYDHFILHLVHLIGPGICGVLVALAETFIAISLLTGKWLHIYLPLGAALALGIWTTAEGWGGPYSAGTTGMPGNLIGDSVLYLFVCIFLIAVYYPLLRAQYLIRSPQLTSA